MTKTYGVTREKTAQVLGVSTRTIDRYIKSWRLSYKKVANKVLLCKEEIAGLQDDFSALHQEVNTEIIGNQWSKTLASKSSLEASIDEKVDKFFLIFKEKDRILEEKNKLIFMLQQRVGELENKIQTMIALPDYTKEKQEAIIEKERLEAKIDELKGKIKGEKIKNLVFIALAVIFIGLATFFFTKG